MRYTVLFILALTVATCGQKGPLELPENNAKSRSGYGVTQSSLSREAVLHDVSQLR